MQLKFILTIVLWMVHNQLTIDKDIHSFIFQLDSWCSLAGVVATGSELGLAVHRLLLLGRRTRLLLSSLSSSLPRGITLLAGLEHLILMSQTLFPVSTCDLGKELEQIYLARPTEDLGIYFLLVSDMLERHVCQGGLPANDRLTLSTPGNREVIPLLNHTRQALVSTLMYCRGLHSSSEVVI